MQELNEVELASVVGGMTVVKTIRSTNVAVIFANTGVYIVNAKIDDSWVGNYNGAVITIYS